MDVKAQSCVVKRAIQLACYISKFHLVLDICLDLDTETVVAVCHCEVTSLAWLCSRVILDNVKEAFVKNTIDEITLRHLV